MGAHLLMTVWNLKLVRRYLKVGWFRNPGGFTLKPEDVPHKSSTLLTELGGFKLGEFLDNSVRLAGNIS